MRKVLLLIVILFTGFTSSYGSHVMGGDITYTCLGGNVYEVTLTLYRDCSGATIGTGTQTVDFTSSCGTQNVALPFLSSAEVSQLCGTATSTCAGGTQPGTEQFVFQGQVTLLPCVDWIMSWDLCCRNNAITNLVNPSSESLYLQTTLNSTVVGCNNSAQFLNLPTPYLCANNLAIYSHAASDIDGDSLYYTFNNPLTTPGPPGTPIAFAAGYTLLQPVITTAGMNFDQTTGEMCFTPSQGQIVVISVLIEEFRNGILIGSIIREMQVVVDPTCTNQNPTTGVAATCGGAATLNLTLQGPSVIQTDPNSVVMCPNDSVCFEVDFSDPDGDNVTLSTNVAASIPGATFTVTNNGSPTPVATFCWVPTPLDSGLNVFAIIAVDDACPISGTQSFVFDVTVFDQPYAGVDQTICGAQTAPLNASGGAGYTWSVISGDPIVVGTNFSCTNCTSPIASPSITTTYLLTSSLTAACINTDTVTINVVADIIPTAYGDTLLCDFLPHQIGVTVNPPAGPYTYSWTPAATLSNPNIANPIANPTQTTTYSVLVTSALGCAKIDSTTITVNPPPSVTLIPGDTTICQGDAIQIDVSLTAVEDNFTGAVDPAVWSNVSGASVGTPCVPFNGDALNFDSGSRDLTTNSANVASCTSIDFCLWIGNDISTGVGGCENADLGEDVQLNYSINGGATWVPIQTFVSGDWDAIGPYSNNWQCFSIPIPPGAATANTMFQWTQVGGYGGTIDNWALDDIAIMCGGNTNFSYNWIPATALSDATINNPIATPAATTVYTVTLTDTSGCSVDRSQTITVVPNYTFTTTQSDTNVCLGETVSFNVTPNPAGPYNYSWTPAGIMNNPAIANPIATITTPGQTMVTVTIDNGGGCTKLDTFYVNSSIGGQPVVTATASDTLLICGGTSTLGANVVGATLTCQETATATGQDDSPTTVATVNSFNCVPAGAIITAITLDASFTGTFCPTWYTYDIIINGTTQYLQQCNQTGLDLSAFLPITSVSIDANDEDAFSDNVTLNLALNITYSASPYNFTWTPGLTLNDPTIQNPIATPTTTTDYIVTATDTVGGCFDTDTITVVAYCLVCFQPTISVITNPTCKDATDGKIIIDPTFVNGSEIQDFTWTDSITGTVLQTTLNLSAGMTDSLVNIGAGAYTITMVDTSGCSQDTTIYLVDPDSVMINSITPDNVVCIGGNIQVDATAIDGNGGPYTYTWTDLSTGAPIPGNGPHTVSPIITPTCYSVFATDPLGCISSVSQVCMDLYPGLIVSTSNPDTTICPNESTTIDMSVLGGSGVGYSYEWFENGSSIGFGSTISITPTTSPTTYIGYVTDNCTTPYDSVFVVVDWYGLVIPDFTRNKPDSCYPITIGFANTSTPAALVGSSDWTFSDGTTLTGDPVNKLFDTPNCQDVTLTVTTIDGCVVPITKTDFVCPHDYPVANYSMNPPITDLLNTTVEFTDLSIGGVPPYSYLWNFNSGLFPDTSIAMDPIFNFPDDTSGNYPVLLTVTDNNGCQDEILGTVVVNGIYLFYVPNSFTPDGDGLNEIFRPYSEGIDFTNYSMEMFDRWGNSLYQTDNAEIGWDGTYNGKPVPVGTYIWKIIAKEGFTPIIHDNYGHVTIIK